MDGDCLEAIRDVVVKGYIEGIHRKQNKSLALSGFHHDFDMIVLNNNHIEKVNLDKWLDRVATMKIENPQLWQKPTDCIFSLIDYTDKAAALKVDVFKGEVHFSTDYMLLYKIAGEWKIVSKIFAAPA